MSKAEGKMREWPQSFPWRYGADQRLYDCMGRTVADCRYTAFQGPAIVAAVNAYPAAEEMYKALDALCRACDAGTVPPDGAGQSDPKRDDAKPSAEDLAVMQVNLHQIWCFHSNTNLWGAIAAEAYRIVSFHEPPRTTFKRSFAVPLSSE